MNLFEKFCDLPQTWHKVAWVVGLLVIAVVVGMLIMLSFSRNSEHAEDNPTLDVKNLKYSGKIDIGPKDMSLAPNTITVGKDKISISKDGIKYNKEVGDASEAEMALIRVNQNYGNTPSGRYAAGDVCADGTLRSMNNYGNCYDTAYNVVDDSAISNLPQTLVGRDKAKIDTKNLKYSSEVGEASEEELKLVRVSQNYGNTPSGRYAPGDICADGTRRSMNSHGNCYPDVGDDIQAPGVANAKSEWSQVNRAPGNMCNDGTLRGDNLIQNCYLPAEDRVLDPLHESHFSGWTPTGAVAAGTCADGTLDDDNLNKLCYQAADNPADYALDPNHAGGFMDLRDMGDGSRCSDGEEVQATGLCAHLPEENTYASFMTDLSKVQTSKVHLYDVLFPGPAAKQAKMGAPAFDQIYR